MPIDDNHPEYNEYSKQWSKIKIAIEGEDAVKEAGVSIVPKLKAQNETDYESYVSRGLFFAATGRTHEALIGMFTDPQFDEGKSYIGEGPITSDGKDFVSLYDEVLSLMSSTGRVACLVDIDDQAKPYISVYNEQSFVNWKISKIGERSVLTKAVFEEKTMESDPEDEYALKCVIRRRELSLITVNGNNIVQIKVWRKKQERDVATKSFYVEEKSYFPTLRGKYFDKILLTVGGRTKLGYCVEKPPLIDLVNVNFSHFRSSVDLEHGRHFTALPTPWAAGFATADKNKKLHIGSTTAWVSEDASARCGFLEFTGAGLKELSTALDQKEKYMAILGVRILDMDKLAAEGVDTLIVRKSAENNVIDKQAINISAFLSEVLTNYASVSGVTSKVKIKVTRKQIDLNLDPQMLTALMGQVQSGLISWDTYFEKLQQGQIINPTRTKQQEKDLIEAGAPAGKPGLHGDPTGNQGSSGGGIATDPQNVTRNSNPTRVVHRTTSNSSKGRQ